jgi:WD40 repeat protein
MAPAACSAFGPASRDGKWLAAAGYYKGVVQVFEITSGKEIARFRPHDSAASLAFADDGAALITGGEDSTLLVWDFHSKALKHGQ